MPPTSHTPHLPASLHGRIIHAYNPGDYALDLMRLRSQVTLQNHFHRQTNAPLREPRNLATKPGLLQPGQRRFAHTPTAIEPAVGARPHPMVAQDENLNALQLGWEPDAHSDFYGQPVYQVSQWFTRAMIERQSVQIGVQR